MKKTVLVVALGVIALALGAYIGSQKFRLTATTSTATLAQIELPDIDKNLRNGNEWLGKVVVVNHWATWCPPCREEIPLLIDYQQRHQADVQIIGIAHDILDTVRAYSDEIGMNYPSLVAIVGGTEIMKQHGNAAGGLPFTAFFDRAGNIVSTQLGTLSPQDLEAAIAPLL